MGKKMGDYDIEKDWMASMDNIGEKTLGPVSILEGMQLRRCGANREQFRQDDKDGSLTQAHASAVSAGKPIPEETRRRRGKLR